MKNSSGGFNANADMKQQLGGKGIVGWAYQLWRRPNCRSSVDCIPPTTKESTTKDSSGGFKANTDMKGQLGGKGIVGWANGIWRRSNCRSSVHCILPTNKETSTKESIEVQSTTENIPDRKLSTKKSRKSSRKVAPILDPSASLSEETLAKGSIRIQSTTGHGPENIPNGKLNTRKSRRKTSRKVASIPELSASPTSTECTQDGSINESGYMTRSRLMESSSVQMQVHPQDAYTSSATKNTLAKGSIEVQSTTRHEVENKPDGKFSTRKSRKSSRKVASIPDPSVSPTSKECTRDGSISENAYMTGSELMEGSSVQTQVHPQDPYTSSATKKIEQTFMHSNDPTLKKSKFINKEKWPRHLQHGNSFTTIKLQQELLNVGISTNLKTNEQFRSVQKNYYAVKDMVSTLPVPSPEKEGGL